MSINYPKHCKECGSCIIEEGYCPLCESTNVMDEHDIYPSPPKYRPII